MPGDAQESLSREQRLDEAVTAFLEAQEAGQRPQREEWLARYPEVATELEQYFADRDEVDRLTVPLRTALQGTPPPGDTPQPGSPDDASSAVSPSALANPPEGYELLQVLGQGGMGVVYKARQKNAGRLVALKLIRAERLTSEADVQRFRNEAEAAAQLDHPHIVPVYEVGARPGHFFFSMKLIEGGGLDEQLDRFRDDPARVARLVAQMARAVHHAHQRGILHRDLKPSNILLDREGQPHVSDFGLAKRIEADASLTQTGAIVGTPQYMAPEQTRGQKGAITTAADVYGLGAVLYALLTGRPPFQGETVLETLEQVREREPKPPRRLNPKVDRDLETICLKCLHKEPQKRYESAQALAEDLEHWLRSEPIRARRSSTWERLQKWIRRRPAVAALAATVVLAAIAFVGGLLWHNEKLQRAAERERAEADRARQGRQLARQAVDRMYTQVATEWLEDEPQLSDLQRRFLEEALLFYQELSKEDDESTVRQDTARVYRYMGDILAKMDRRPEAEQAYNKSIESLSELLTERPEESSMAYELARTFRGMGMLMYRTGRTQTAEKVWRRGLAIAEKLVQDHPSETEYQLNLGNFCLNLGLPVFEPTEAEKFLHRGQETLEKFLAGSPNNAKYHATLGSILNNLAIWRMMQKKPSEARRLLEQAIEQNQEALKINPRLKTALLSLRNHYSSLGGDVLPALGLHEEALKSAREGLAVAQRLSADFPAVPFYLGNVAESQGEVGRALKDLGRLEEAEAALRQACTLWEKAIARFPDVPHDHGLFAEACTSLGQILEARGHDREAIAAYRRALNLDPKSSNCKNNLAWALVVLGGTTKQHAAEAVTLARQATQEKPLVWQTWNALGGALYRAEQWNESIQALEKAMQLKKAGLPPPSHMFWAMAQWHLGNKAQAKDRYRLVSQAMENVKNWSTEWKRVHAEATALLRH